VTTSPSPALRVDVHLDAGDLRRELADDARAGLAAVPKELPPKWFYDERGCQLFDAITRLPEYYPTRRERAILAAEAGTIARLAPADTLVELGSGTSEKTRILLDALAGAGRLRRFVPFDVSEPTLWAAGDAVANEYPGVEVHAVVGDLERHVGVVPDGGHRLFAFLGGTIGNLPPARRRRLLGQIHRAAGPGEGLLLGTDLVKDVARLEAAYDDEAGVTAEFNRNVLCVLNRELGADFVPERFQHVARFDADREWIEMGLRSTVDQSANVAALALDVRFAAGEEMRTEISAKFRRDGVESELAASGFELARWWTDPAGDFALSLSFAT
jgi:L-histidine N-alpha-methyltransferase